MIFIPQFRMNLNWHQVLKNTVLYYNELPLIREHFKGGEESLITPLAEKHEK